MAIVKYKPTSPGMRFVNTSDFSDITKSKPEKSLTLPLRSTGGRNQHGRITSRHRGGGHKRRLRIIDFKRDKKDMPAKVIAVEYDPNRSARIALLEYEDGERRYIVCPLGLRVGEVIVSGENVEIKVGNSMPLKNIPTGTFVHNVELRKGEGAVMARGAGTAIQIMAKEGGYAHLKLPSTEMRLVNLDCLATIGQVSNIEHDSISLGKAGKSRYRGIRPSSRGVAKNPVDHPMGGGEGKSSGGRHPTTPWGKKTKGLKTRKNKSSGRFIITRRVKKPKKKK